MKYKQQVREFFTMINNLNKFWAFLVIITSFFFFNEPEIINVMVCENLNKKTPQPVDWLKTEHTASQTEKNRQTVERAGPEHAYR